METPPIPVKKSQDEMSILSPLLLLYTVVYLAMMIGDFVAREKFDMPTGMMAVYVALLGAYAADKEIRRWLGKSIPPKMGSIFVYLWLVFFLVAFVIHSFWTRFAMPSDLSPVALQVLGVFFGSKASKKIYDMKTGKAEEALGREETILQIIRDRGKVTRKEIMDALKLSDSSVGRILAEMEAKKAIQQVGSHKGTYYTLLTQ